MKKKNTTETITMDEAWKQIDKCIDACKAEALKEVEKLSKKDLISQTLGSMITANFKMLNLIPELRRRYIQGERLCYDKTLDSMGDDGIIIGATAFRLAEQLEIELPDNGMKPKEYTIATFIDGQEVSDYPCESIDLSSVYVRFFMRHHDSLFLQNNYLYERIQDGFTSCKEYHKKIAKALWEMQMVCNDHIPLLYVHDCLKNICLNVFSDEEIDMLYLHKKECKAVISELSDTISKKDHERVTRNLISVSMALEDIEAIMKQGKA